MRGCKIETQGSIGTQCGNILVERVPCHALYILLTVTEYGHFITYSNIIISTLSDAIPVMASHTMAVLSTDPVRR